MLLHRRNPFYFRSIECLVERVHSALIVPAAALSDAADQASTVAAVCLVNKRGGGGGDGQFGEVDERIASTCLRQVSSLVRHSRNSVH